MDPKYVPILDLFKYPILIFSILGALIVAQKSDMPISKISTDGIELRELVEKIDSAKSQGNLIDQDLYVRVSTLESRIKAITEASPDIQKAQIKQIEINQILEGKPISEKVAQLSSKDQKSGTYIKGKEGWVYIGKVKGNYWRPFHLRTINFNVIGKTPDLLDVGGDYKVSANLVLRSSTPDSNLNQPESLSSFGVIPQRTNVTLLESPKSFQSGQYKLYWAKIRVNE